MAETTNYKLYTSSDGKTKFQEWREEVAGGTNSNMTKIEDALTAHDEALASKQDKITGTTGQVVGFDADGNPAPQGTEELKGADGKSAYQQAVDGGYTGTEEEFEAILASGPWLPFYSSDFVPNVKTLNDYIFFNTGSSKLKINGVGIRMGPFIIDRAIEFKYTSASFGMPDSILITTSNGNIPTEDKLVLLRGVAYPQCNFDAANKKYVDDLVGDIGTLLDSINGEVV